MRSAIVLVALMQLSTSAPAHAQLRTATVASGLGAVVGVVPDPVYAGVLHVIQQDGVVRTIGTATPCVGAPPAPGAVTATVSNRVASLVWRASGTISSVVLEAGYSPGASNAAAIVLDGSARAFSTAAPPATYHVRVRAANACGTSAASNETTVIVP